MYNLPYLAYGVFALVLLGTLIVGYRKGMATAIYSLGLTAAASALGVALAFVLYDSVKEPIGDWFKDSKSGNDAFDFTPLVDENKPQVISVIVALSIVPLYFICFGISYPLIKWFRRRDNPKTLEQISSNTKLVSSHNTSKNRTVGVVVTTTTSFLSAALIAASITPIVTNSEEHNFFTDATNSISRAMTFGQGYSTKEMQELYDFIPYTKDDDIMLVWNKLIRPDGTPLTQAEIDKFNADPKSKDLIQLMNDTEVKAILNTINTNENYDRDSVWLPLGHEDGLPYDLATSNMIPIWASINLGVSSGTASDIASWVEANAIQDFEDTLVYKRWEEWDKATMDIAALITEAETTHAGRIEMLADAEGRLTNAHQERADAHSSLEQTIATHNGRIPTIDQNERDEEAQRLISENAEAEYNTAVTEFNTYKTNEYDPMKKIYDDFVSNLKSIESKISGLQSDIDKLEAEKKDIENNKVPTLEGSKQLLETRLNGYQGALPGYEADVTNKQSDMNAKATTLSDKQQDLTTAVSAQSTAQSRFNQAKSDYEAARKAYDDYQSSSTYDPAQSLILENKRDAAKTEMEDRQTILNNAVKATTSATAARDAAQSTYDAASIAHTNAVNTRDKTVQDITSAQSEISNIDNQLQGHATRVAAIDSEVLTKSQEKNGETSKLPGVQAQIDSAKIDWDATKPQFDLNKADMDAKKKVKDDEAAKYTAAQNKTSEEKRKFDSEENEIANAIDNELPKMLEVIQTIKTEIVQLEGNSTAPGWTEPEWFVSHSNPNTGSYNNIISLSETIEAQNLKGGIDYELSIPYMSNPGGQEVATTQETLYDGDVYQNKDLKLIGAGTEGKLQILQFKLAQAEDNAAYLASIRDDLHEDFNDNIADYLAGLEAALVA